MDGNKNSSETLALDFSQLAQLLTQCDRTMRRFIKQAVELLPIEEQEFLVLSICHQYQQAPPAQSVLVQKLAVSAPQVSNLVEQLRQKGLIEGHRDPNDRRRQVWVLTPSGHQIVQQAYQSIAQDLSKIDSKDALDQFSSVQLILEAVGSFDPQSKAIPTFQDFPNQKAA
ncbi:MAG: MarR family winged helix-turn-helix transcriptional regulator [Pirellulales bacterium]|jgi:DNA-binding MarR family transcriptional regulator